MHVLLRVMSTAAMHSMHKYTRHQHAKRELLVHAFKPANQHLAMHEPSYTFQHSTTYTQDS
jgi:hypothetical protein